MTRDTDDDEQETDSPARRTCSKDKVVKEQVDGRKDPNEENKEEEEDSNNTDYFG
jgi:hypothetical protein